MAAIKAIIWDLDGFLIDSEPYHTEAEIETVKQYGIDLTPAIIGQYFGLGTKDYFEQLAQRFAVNLPIEKMVAKHKNNLVHYYRNIMPLTPYAVETLSQLQSIYRMVLATSTKKELVDIVLRRFSFHPYFQAVLCREDVKCGKPDPEVFLTTSSKLNVEPHNVAVVEDLRKIPQLLEQMV